jgi:hypothetical protein
VDVLILLGAFIFPTGIAFGGKTVHVRSPPPSISSVLRHLNPDTFLRYSCVGISTAFSIVNYLDKLMVATKELIREEYHIHGIGIVQKGGYEPPPTPGSTYPQTSKEV